ncbi:hypothetical protein [Hyperthermus butylicus]|uniref:Uncharacterized protein n=1 Tax=Hyperthermus butylicus (strain DSM 5456 / JCM 9403 / PLM1-5) TaxID=415426 RepID=A2BLZ7_HYPBU|nr:hypothetical protein [Hyperthermus butylicus]ABM81008.1 hypothetical protein Hbut_1173 [Hyperthermus butylicus DSM 5456]
MAGLLYLALEKRMEQSYARKAALSFLLGYVDRKAWERAVEKSILNLEKIVGQLNKVCVASEHGIQITQLIRTLVSLVRLGYSLALPVVKTYYEDLKRLEDKYQGVLLEQVTVTLLLAKRYRPLSRIGGDIGEVDFVGYREDELVVVEVKVSLDKLLGRANL